MLFHEGVHALELKSQMLRGKDRLIFRDKFLRIAKRFDPLRSIESFFAPEGKYPEALGDSELDAKLRASVVGGEMLMTDYAVNTLFGAATAQGESMDDYMYELRDGLMLLGNDDIFSDLWPGRIIDLESYINYMKATVEVGDINGLPKLVAQTIIDHKEAIVWLKRAILLRDVNGPSFIPNILLPMILTHLAMYQPEKLVEQMTDGRNHEAKEAFMKNWQVRLRGFVEGVVYEELVGVVIASMLNDRSDNKDEWKETRQDFQEMLDVLKKNHLAVESMTS